MPVPEGKQFITLYRGLQGVQPHRVNHRSMGDIWTSSYGVAHTYASGQADDNTKNSTFGTIVRASVPVHAIKEDDTGDDLKEYRLHPGSKVEVNSKEFVQQRGESKRHSVPDDYWKKYPMKGTI